VVPHFHNSLLNLKMLIPSSCRRVLLLVIALLYNCSIQGQDAREYSFTHYTTSSGLLSNQVNAVVQDGDGYIWTGSTDGLQRYDGVRYLSFRHNANDSISLPSNPVGQLILDRKKRLWVLLADGNVGIFNTKNFTFHKALVKPTRKDANQAIYKRLSTDENGNIFYFFYGKEIITWNEQRFEFSAEHNFFKLKPEWVVSDFIQQPGTKKYWIGVQRLGAAVFDLATGRLSYPGNNIDKEPVVDAIDSSIYFNQTLFDQKGRAWFFCWSTVYPNIFCFDTKTKQLAKYELLTSIRAYHETHAFFEQRDGSIWVRGLKVFARFNEQQHKFQLVYNGYTNERSIAYDFITALYEDREGNVWTGTDNNGLYRFNPAQEYFSNVTHVNRLSGNKGNGAPMSFIETKWHTYFVGTWEDGLYHYDSNFNMLPAHIKGLDDKGGPFVWNMFASADSNTIWMASQPGVYAVDQARRTATFYNPSILEGKTVRQIAEDKNRNLWLGMIHTGLFKWNTDNGRVIPGSQPVRINAVPADAINKIMIDRQGLIWVATGASGLYLVDPDTDAVLLHFAKDGTGKMKLPEAGVSSVLDYNDSLIVITTATKVILYHRGTQKMYDVGPPDVISGYIASVERDKKGFVWIASTSGLYRVAIRRGAFVRFTKEDGIQSDNFNLGASHSLNDGRLLFGSSSQFIVFDPLKMNNNKNDLQIIITDFKVMNKPWLVDSLLQLKEIVLGYDENSLTVDFSTLLYNSPALIQYKLDGLDKDWKTADKDNEAVYSYLPNGVYTLLFKIFDENGNSKDSELKIRIRVNPPFWKSWWFFGTMALVIGLLFFWADKARMKRSAALQQMRTDIADNLHKEVNTALNNINILSEMARMKADDEPQKSKEFIEQINSKSHNMIIAMDDMLWSISPDNDSMQKTVERMQEYIDAFNQRHGAGIVMLVDEKVTVLKLDMQFRHEAFLLFKESIKGLLHAGATNCNIHVALEKYSLLYTVQFNNDNCDMQQLNNLLQRQDMAKRLKAIDADFNIELHKSNSLFELKVPLR